MTFFTPPRAVRWFIRIVAIVVFLLLLPAVSRADGWYIATGTGRADMPIPTQIGQRYAQYGFYLNADAQSDTAHGLMGFRDGAWSAEAGYHDYGDYALCLQNVLLPAHDKLCASATARAWSIGVRAHADPFYIAMRAQRYTVTANLITRTDEISGWLPSAGIGFTAPITPSFRVRFEAQYPRGLGYILGFEHDLK